MAWIHFVGWVHCCTVHCVEIQLYSALCGDTAGDILLYSALCGDTAGDILLTICYSGDRMNWEEMGEHVTFVVERRSAYRCWEGERGGWQGVEWINLARWGHMADPVNTAMNFRVL